MNEQFFSTLANTRPFLKMALEGFSGTGKTFTAVEIALGLHKKIKSTKPIAIYDTEKSMKALKPKFDKAGIEVIVKESRSLADCTKTIDLCKDGAADIVIIDSITHVWESFIQAYREQYKRTFIQFQDWGILKPKWKQEFSDRVVLSNLHIIFTGRAGYEYEQEINEVTNKKELVKSGIKMKVENETEYEPDIVILMEKIKKLNGKMTIKRQATIIKDRTTIIDGKVFENPKYKDFQPAINLLLDGTYVESDITEGKDTFEHMEDEMFKKKTSRDIALELIESSIVRVAPGQSAKEKKLKVEILNKVFGTTSWTAISKMELNQLNEGASVCQRFSNSFLMKYAEKAEQGIELDQKEILDMIQ